MRALLVLVVAMGVLIAAGVATVAVTILHRMGGPSAATQTALLDEPAGTRIISVSAYGNRLALVLQGGGPDRIAIVDPATGQHLGGVSLSKRSPN